MILDISWEQFEAYLVTEGKQSDGSLSAHRNAFKRLTAFLTGHELQFNRANFNSFIYSAKKAGAKATYLNNFIKMVKHLGRCVHTEEFNDYTFFHETLSPPQETLTPEEITKLAECKIKYHRYTDRKVRYPALIYFLGNLGSRIDETLKLEWRDITHHDYPLVHFRAEIVKTKKERYCAIPKWLDVMIQTLPHTSAFVFAKCERTIFSSDLKLRAQMCQINKNVHPHLFRDSSITNKLRAGVPLEEVSSYHGHVDINTTYKYYIAIKAEIIRHNLSIYDYFYRKEQTFDQLSEYVKKDSEKIFNPNISHYSYKQSTTDDNKKRVIIEFTEK